MDFASCFPIWDKLTPEQQHHISAMSEFRRVKAGTVLHDDRVDCLGLLLVRSGQLRAYILSAWSKCTGIKTACRDKSAGTM